MIYKSCRSIQILMEKLSFWSSHSKIWYGSYPNSCQIRWYFQSKLTRSKTTIDACCLVIIIMFIDWLSLVVKTHSYGMMCCTVDINRWQFISIPFNSINLLINNKLSISQANTNTHTYIITNHITCDCWQTIKVIVVVTVAVASAVAHHIIIK